MQSGYLELLAERVFLLRIKDYENQWIVFFKDY